MILVTGAGGKTGRALVRALGETEGVCAFVHRQQQTSILRSLGADRVIVGEMRDEAAVRSAMRGARCVYHICPNMSPDELVIGDLVVQEARRSRVENFVYHSVLHPQTEKMSHHSQKLRVEEIILESGLPFTILQPAPYMQNILAGWKHIVQAGVLRVPYSVTSKFSFVDLVDVAEAARIVLTEPGHICATYELAGTLPLSYVEVADVLSHALNLDVQAEEEEIADWRARAKALDDYALENLARMFEYYAQRGLAGNPNVLGWLLRREPTSLESFVRRMVQDPDVPM